MNWFETHLGLVSVREKSTYFQNDSSAFKWNLLLVDNINIIFFGQPGYESYWWPEEFKVTDGSSIDHIAFSFERIDNVFAQIKSAGVEIVHDISTNHISGVRVFCKGSRRAIGRNRRRETYPGRYLEITSENKQFCGTQISNIRYSTCLYVVNEQCESSSLGGTIKSLGARAISDVVLH